jgi:hypothetical protein
MRSRAPPGLSDFGHLLALFDFGPDVDLFAGEFLKF